MTVDREARASYAELIRQFLACQITNDEFHDGTPFSATGDHAVGDIFGELWYCYDDLTTHRAEGRYALNESERDLFNRCLLFLESGLEYEWPQLHRSERGAFVRRLGRILATVMTFGLFGKWARIRFVAAMQRIGDYSVWPFFRRKDYERERGKIV